MREPAQIPQLSLAGVLGLWLLVTVPMAALSLGLAPLLIHRHPQTEPGVIFWWTIIAGMFWQCVVAVGVLFQERRSHPFVPLAQRLWLNAPRNPATRRSDWSLLWWVVPLGAASVFVTDMAFGWLDDVLADVLPSAMKPAWGEITALASPENKGAWHLVGTALVSSAFNYALGEALFFHGVLLPRCQRVFGRYNWLANAMLFGGYHVHKATAWPTVVISCVAYSLPAQMTRSNWPAILVHGVEGLVLLAAVLYVVAIGV
jgi:uncharacterized protein